MTAKERVDVWLRRLQNMSRITKTLAFSVSLLLLSVSLLIIVVSQYGEHVPGPPTDAEVPSLCGWAGPEAAEAAWMEIGSSFPKFEIEGPVEDREKVCLWDAERAVLDGKLIPTFRQLIGDCVGAGAKQATERLLCVHIAFRGTLEEFKPLFSPYHYACGRNAPECGNGRIRGPDGSIGSWQAKALELYGVLPADHEGLPGYSKQVVSTWAVRMPSAAYVQIGKRHLVRSAARVSNAQQVKAAIQNWYPVTVASNWGGQMRPPLRGNPQVRLNSRATTWMHQMCVLGYWRHPELGELFYILNSWGPDAHGAPAGDEPPGGFWVLAKEIDYITKQGDSFALSDIDGFPSRDIDLDQLLGFRELRRRVRHAGTDGDSEDGAIDPRWLGGWMPEADDLAPNPDGGGSGNDGNGAGNYADAGGRSAVHGAAMARHRSSRFSAAAIQSQVLAADEGAQAGENRGGDDNAEYTHHRGGAASAIGGLRFAVGGGASSGDAEDN